MMSCLSRAWIAFQRPPHNLTQAMTSTQSVSRRFFFQGISVDSPFATVSHFLSLLRVVRDAGVRPSGPREEAESHSWSHAERKLSVRSHIRTCRRPPDVHVAGLWKETGEDCAERTNLSCQSNPQTSCCEVTRCWASGMDECTRLQEKCRLTTDDRSVHTLKAP